MNEKVRLANQGFILVQKKSSIAKRICKNLQKGPTTTNQLAVELGLSWVTVRKYCKLLELNNKTLPSGITIWSLNIDDYVPKKAGDKK